MTSPAEPQPRIPGILHLAWPLVVSFALRAAFTWVDRIYAAYLPDPDVAQAAIGLAQPIEFLLIACWVGSSNGLTSRLAAAMGAREGARVEQLKRASLRLIWSLVVLFVLIAAAIWFSAPRLGLEANLARGFQVYGVALIGGSALTGFWAILPDSLVKAHQDTRTTMWAGIISSVVNVAFNTLFVFVFHWGLFGIGLSTAIGRLGGLAYSIWKAGQHERARVGAGRDTAPGLYDRPIRALLTIAIPSGLTYVLMAAEGFAVNGILANSHTSSGATGAALKAIQADALAAWSVFGAAVSFLAMPAIAVGVAMLPLAARLGGAAEGGRLRSELRTALLAWAGFGLLVVVPLGLFGWPWLTDVLLESEQAIQFAARARWILPLVVLVLGPFMITRPLFDAMAASRTGLLLSCLRSLGLIVPCTFAGGLIAVAMGASEMGGMLAGNGLGVAGGTTIALVSALRLVRTKVPPQGDRAEAS
ncbi:MATE family efflux transporter [Engelhardtia mirabilis]|uniref:Multidrug efflux protein n=1 Tax=Engelhardtia mirabilis TaxID=2528011 RepID=A0A518BNL4_9BACT|nr:multidrug efflux protein [Planctomycetes bacterium Pla133]QDV02886.1 multidrug efflux protein [Planctomycetes bacterium Pla86]